MKTSTSACVCSFSVHRYRKPFDLLAKGTEMKEWLGRRDSNPNNLLQRQVSYR